MLAIGLMSGTSMDGIDIAMIDTDGEQLNAIVARGGRPYRPDERALLADAMRDAEDMVERSQRPGALAEVERMITAAHAGVVLDLLARQGIARRDVDIVGFHGQTVLHRPDIGLTVQLGDGALLAERIGIDVVHDFRAADMAAGGQGAPIVPAYHAALAAQQGWPRPLAIINVGGVANMTFIASDGTLTAFDVGPGNAPIDDWVAARAGLPFDRGGSLALAGRADADQIANALRHPFFRQPPPKSLDRRAFSLPPVGGLSLEDGAATLTGITAAGIFIALAHFGEVPALAVLCGGGARNDALVGALDRLIPCDVRTADALGLDSATIEAEAVAYLAARSLRGLPLSFPGTTGVPSPQPGGVLARASAA